MTDEFRQVSNAVALINNVGRQVDEMMNYLHVVTTSGTLHAQLSLANMKVRTEEAPEVDDDWVCSRCARNFSLMRKKAKKPQSFFGYQVDLDGVYLGLGEPVLHVFGNWDACVTFDPDDEDTNFIEPFWSQDDESLLSLQDDTLIEWWDADDTVGPEGDKPSEYGWQFTIRLRALTDAKRVDELVFGPVIQLLAKNNRKLAFGDPGYVRLELREGTTKPKMA